MSKEAIKLVVDKIKSTFWEGYVPEPVKPAQQLVDCHATGVCVQSGLRAEQPAQQEPVARQYQNRDGVWKDFISEKHYKDTLEDGSWPIRNLYTSPQAQRKPLTNEQIGKASRDAHIAFCLNKHQTYEHALTRAVEAAHGIKENT